MKRAEITTAVVEESLSAWRYAHPLSSPLENLAVLETLTASPHQPEQPLREFVTNIVLAQLHQERHLAGCVPDAPLTSKKGVKAALRADFQSKQKPLLGWSALFFRYLSPVSLSVAELATAVPLSTRQFRRYVNQGVAQLTALLRQEEHKAQKQQRQVRLQRFLPAPDYTQLFGTDAVVDDIVARLTAADGPRFLSIEGLGGIGKTAVAQTVAYQLAETGAWQDILWISAKQDRLTTQWQLEEIDDPVHSLADVISRICQQLGQEELAGLPVAAKLAGLNPILTSKPHLIIIDNLETLTDTQALLPALFPLAGLTRFLLTSRHSLRDVGFVHILPLPALSLSASRSLIEHELRRHGQTVTLSTATLAAIYETVGGLPLALKLLAAQLGDLPLQHLLAGLKSAQRQGPRRIYRFIYHHAWRLLSDAARHLLLTMLLVSPDGEDVAWMKLMSNLATADFDEALTQLRRYSLLEAAGGLESPRYRLHRLTITFLKTDVLLQWQPEMPDNSHLST